MRKTGGRGYSMVRKILVATDGSKVAGKAVKYAIGLAKQLDKNASITLLGVVDILYLIMQGASPAITSARVMMETKDILNQATAEYLDEALSECRKKGVRARKIMRTGHAVEEIVKEAVKERADLIVLGSHGRSALKAAVLGSVAFGVIHKDTDIPVLIVRK
jgi:nucleotide-binding universal stress UspA family protein